MAILLFLGSPGARAQVAPEGFSLAGTWRFQLDRDSAGLTQRWFESTLPDQVWLPGTLSAQGIGDAVSVDTKWIGGIVDQSWFTAPEYAPYRQPDGVKIPFWLQPERYYAGAAWYQRDIYIPSSWKDKRVVLTLERPHWETRVWLDDAEVGSNNSLSTPHEYSLGTALAPGNHRLTIRVDNSLVVDVGINSHSVSDHTQGNWNGIAGRIELAATSPVWIDDLQVYPQIGSRSLAIKGRLGNATGQPGSGQVLLTATPLPENDPSLPLPATPSRQIRVSWEPQGGQFEAEYPLGPEARLWDEFHPALYRLNASLNDGQHTTAVTFGLREVSAQGTQITLNGRNIFIRGTLECAIFPKTGHPPTDLNSWRNIIHAAQAHGLNLFRFHSWCPPEAAFAAADELGFYLQVECASWANQSTTLGDGKPVDSWLYEEAGRILKYYGNHPSFLLMAYGNEPGGRRHTQYLADWVRHWKSADPRRLHTSGAGWPQLPENQFHLTPDPRIQGWGQGLRSRINSQPPETRTDYRRYIQARAVPVISHEIGQWCVYPNFDEMPKYTGYLKPKNFEIFQDTLNAHHLGDLARPFLMASGKLQALCYKEDIEAALRTPGMAGFQLLDLHDFPGQGTALVGLLDPFWETKGYITPAAFRRFCNSTVPLARLGQRVFTTRETLEADLEVAHFGPAPLDQAVTTWELVGSNGSVLAKGELPPHSIPVDNGVALGRIGIDLNHVPAPQQCRLVVRLTPSSSQTQSPAGTEAAAVENDWDLWVYPPELDLTTPAGITVTEQYDDQTVAALNDGGKVLLLIPPHRVRGDRLGKVALGFSSIFWNTAWTGRQPPHTLGILCQPQHPALTGFPTEFHSNWQWWYLLSRAGAMILDHFPPDARPIVQVVDDWVTARKLGLIFEAKIGTGKLLACSIDLRRDLDQNPVARQLLHSLLRYMAGDQFQPTHTLTSNHVLQVFAAPSPMEQLGARIRKASSFETGYGPENILDNNPATIWHTAWSDSLPNFPHEIQIELKRPATLRGFTVLPRQDNNPNGWIKGYAFSTSQDGEQWSEPAAEGTFSNDARLKTVTLDPPVTARFLRLKALSGHANGPWASLAEFNLIQ